MELIPKVITGDISMHWHFIHGGLEVRLGTNDVTRYSLMGYAC